MLLSGEPGVGKSRLLRETVELGRAEGATVVTGRAVPSGTATPFRPLTEALLQALRDRIPSPGALVEPWLSALRAVFLSPLAATDAAVGAEPVAQDATVLRALRGEGVLLLLRELSRDSTLVLALEDLHWADPDTLQIVDYLADNLGQERVLCLATTRSEPPSAASELAYALHARRSAVVLGLGRLSADEVDRMVRACRPTATAEEVRAVIAVADGVPFLVEELLASPGHRASFRDSVSARLAELAEPQRQVLQVAAVLGRQFDWQLLEAAAGTGPEVVAAALERGVDGLLLGFDANTYRFRHALTRDAVVGALLPHVRARLAQTALSALRPRTRDCPNPGATPPPISRRRPATENGPAPCSSHRGTHRCGVGRCRLRFRPWSALWTC